MFKVEVFVALKNEVVDTAGKAAEDSLRTIGFTGVSQVGIGRYITFAVDAADRQKASSQVEEMCQQLLVNTVIEDYRYELTEV